MEHVVQCCETQVEQVVQLLERTGQLDRTYVVLTSDHGYHMGQFGLAVDKRLPYETDIRVPLLVRGPGVAAGSRVSSAAVSVDLAPTVLDMADIDVPEDMDGVSLLPLLHSAGATKVLSNLTPNLT